MAILSFLLIGYAANLGLQAWKDSVEAVGVLWD
jgi:hypothetical protein